MLLMYEECCDGELLRILFVPYFIVFVRNDRQHESERAGMKIILVLRGTSVHFL